jgi:hypothetical protein
MKSFAWTCALIVAVWLLATNIRDFGPPSTWGLELAAYIVGEFVFGGLVVWLVIRAPFWLARWLSGLRKA